MINTAEFNLCLQRLTSLESEVKRLRLDVAEITKLQTKLQAGIESTSTSSVSSAINYVFLLHVPTGLLIKYRVSYRLGVLGSINSASLLEELRQIARAASPNTDEGTENVPTNDVSFQFEDHSVTVETFGYVMMAVVTDSQPEFHLRQRMRQHLREINTLYRLGLGDYEGQPDRLPMVEWFLDELM
ncbi:MAG: hypothetical protein KIH69_021605 [Anaerolineae bacterium]|nr:hypothetical protein [Anaerolineae bacterium]